MEPPTNKPILYPFETAFGVVVERTETWLQKRIGCSRRELWVLLCVDESNFSQRRIAELLKTHTNTIVKVLDIMEKKKLVRRVSNPADRRENIVQATDRGIEAMAAYEQERIAKLRELFSPLTEEEILRWREMSMRIIRGFPTKLNAGHGGS